MITGPARWLTMVLMMVVLGGCAYPSFNSQTLDKRVRVAGLDPRFPLLKAYQECTLNCPDCYQSCDTPENAASHTFVDFDERSMAYTEIITQDNGQTHTFSYPSRLLLLSYSAKPAVRTLSTFQLVGRFDYNQYLIFYRPAPDGQPKRLLVKLPRRHCPAIEESTQTTGKGIDLWQKVKFVVVVEEQVTIFTEPKADCPGLRVKDVLGEAAGLPADLAGQTYVAYTADAAQGRDGVVVAERLASPRCGVAAPCNGKTVTLALERDPLPDLRMGPDTQGYVCRVHTSSTDWNLFAGMAAKRYGDVSYSRRCKPQK